MLMQHQVTLQRKERRNVILPPYVNDPFGERDRPSRCKIAHRIQWLRLEVLKLFCSQDNFIFVMYYRKIWHVARMRKKQRNACFQYLGSKIIKVQFLPYSCKRTLASPTEEKCKLPRRNKPYLVCIQLPYTGPVAKCANQNSCQRAIYVDTATFIKLLYVHSPFKLLGHRRTIGSHCGR